MTADPAAVRASLADATPDVFWTDRPERPSPRAALTGSGHRADLVVVGGGFTGLWAAIQAKEDDPSRDVVVLERGRFGIAASGRNGGFVASSLTHGLAQGLACWPDQVGTLERLADENRAGFEAALATHGIDAGYHVPGEITMALSEHQVASVHEGYELHRAHGVDATLLDAAGARARVDSPRYLAGWVDPTVGLVDPGRLVWGLADAAERLGVRLHEDTGVTAFDREDGAVVVRTEWGHIRTDRVVLGTGAFRGPLKRLALYTLPVYDHVLMSEPLSPAQLDAVGWRGREGLTDAGNQFHYYRRTLDDRVLFGGYDANYHFPGKIDPRLGERAGRPRGARHRRLRGPLKRLALWTLPVYDHVLMSEPLSAAQLDAVGWRGREGLTDAGNQFHYYRRTLDDRVLFGGYDANYHFPGRIDPRWSSRPRTTCWRSTSSRSSPSSPGCGSPTAGPGSSTPPRASPRCSAPRSAAGCRTPSATPGWGSPRPGSVRGSPSTSSTAATPR